jgi:hypothetical protein
MALGRELRPDEVSAVLKQHGVTLLFAVWEYLEFKFRYSERWRPEALGPVPPPGRQPSAGSRG